MLVSSQPSEESLWKTNVRATTEGLTTLRQKDVAAKGTAPNRFYSYNFYLDTTLEIAGQNTSYTTVPLWKDTLAQIAGTTTFNNTFVSAAQVLDPSFPGFNNPDFFDGEMKITATSTGVSVKSVNLYGVYGYNTAKSGVVDTIRLSFVAGSGGPIASDNIFSGYGTSGGHYGTIDFLDLHYDSVNNYLTDAGKVPALAGTAASMVVDVILNNSGTSPAWGDTTAEGIWMKNVVLPGSGLNIPVNGYAAMSVSFKSGDASFPTTAPGAVVWNNDGTFNYNMWRPLLQYQTDGATDDPQWLTYTDWLNPDSNANAGYYRRLPAYLNGWANTFVPMWAWSTGGGATASTLQHINMEWEIACPTCGVIAATVGINNVTSIEKAAAYPNPATSELNIPFTLSNNANVTVTLSNMLGQVVATQNISNVASGKATFNTSALPAGLYTYAVIANGTRTTGRVAVAH
ncbi:hypothetical protein GCM10023093_23430 [Nemorincola caseinilytica]|uniref:Secretion system C-terminal sorting domain-containing protein n=2 Tax=Nemorincola caseinilytica TaxID=2054315 RepID=A0ABP8NIB6_9BACT